MTDTAMLRRIVLTRDELALVQEGAAVVSSPAAMFCVEGPGAVACVQGIVTADVQSRGPGSVCYGAVLTPKGMIVFDTWLFRDGERIVFVADRSARTPALELFRRQLPPRLAKVTDWSDSHAALAVVGHRSAAAGAALGVPELPGRLVATDGILAARMPPSAPAGLMLIAPLTEDARLRAALALPSADARLADAARVLAGFPALGAEIDDKTLPQEVRFDEHDGTSYTKGCYTGQETVARIHFRGHPNRELRAVRLAESPSALDHLVIVHEGKDVGRVRSLLETPLGCVALAPVRREVPLGASVTLLGTSGVVQLPPLRLE